METNEKKVQCPMHGNDLPLVERDGKMIAICHCPTKGVKNRWKGQVVYSESLPKPKKKKKTRANNAGGTK